jgi:hypothetical protein
MHASVIYKNNTVGIMDQVNNKKGNRTNNGS